MTSNQRWVRSLCVFCVAVTLSGCPKTRVEVVERIVYEDVVREGVSPLHRYDARAYEQADGTYPSLPPPLTAQETTQLREGFDWANTEELAETNVDGQPALYYAMVLLRDASDQDALDMMGVPNDALPWFPSEREMYPDGIGQIQFEMDDVGGFTFAILPGFAFNAIRQHALDGAEGMHDEGPIFEVVVLRQVPDAAASLTDGSLSYDYLSENGFEYWDEANPEQAWLLETLELDEPEVTSLRSGGQKSRCRRLCRLFRNGWRNAVVGILRFSRGIVNAFRVIASELRQQRTMDIYVEVDNIEPEFSHPAVVDPTNPMRDHVGEDEMQRAWGAGAGGPLRLNDSRISVRANLSLTYKSLNDGSASLRVPVNGRRYGLSIGLRNKAADIVAAGVWQRRLVLFGTMDRALHGPYNPPNRTGRVAIVVNNVRHGDVNTLLQMQDSQQAARTLFGDAPIRLRVDTGPGVNWMQRLNELITFRNDDPSQISSAWAPCMSYNETVPPAVGRQTLFGVLDLALTWLNYDIAFARGTDIGEPMRSRGVPTHEYGHVVACDIIYRRAPGRYLSVMSSALLGILSGQESDIARVWEGLADFFSSQVVGGVNYFSPRGSRSVGGMTYCATSSSQECLEDNFGGTGQVAGVPLGGRNQLDVPLDQAIAEYTSTVIDVFDAPAEVLSGVGVGTLWDFSGDPVPSRGRASSGDGENIALSGDSYSDALRGWVRASIRFDHDDLVSGLTGEMREHGVSDTHICELFALHDAALSCVAPVTGPLLPPPANAPIVAARLLPQVAASDLPSVFVSWEDRSVDGASYTLSVSHPGGLLRSEVINYGRFASSVQGGLGYNTEYTFEVEVGCCDEANALGSVTLYSHPEPVGPLAVATLINGADITWAEVDALRYQVEVRRVDTGQLVYNRNNANLERALFSAPGSPLIGGVTYEIRVFSVNRDGVYSAHPAVAIVTPIDFG